MLNKINALLASIAQQTIQEIKTTSYIGTLDGSSSNFIILPDGITEGSLGLLLIASTKTATANQDNIVLSTPTGFTLIDKFEFSAGSGRGVTQGLFYKYMTASDSSTKISTLFANSRGVDATAIFIEVILNRDINIPGFNSLTAFSAGEFISVAATLTDVPSLATSSGPFFLLTCGLAGRNGGGATGITSTSLTGGMQLYDTSETILSTGADATKYVITLWKYNKILIKDLPSTEDAVYTVASGDGSDCLGTGVYVIWFK